MADNPDEEPPRAAVVLHTADGRRLKPACPMCDRIYWGRLVPQGFKPDDDISYNIAAQLNESPVLLGVQLWTCLNCGFLWHRTGGLDETPVEHED